ncbi:MAG: hypothetical protein AB7U44_09560 [Sulfuricurvum sp.]|uniref:hypothetical protein n=1 Tax=Sulfuricurvum sp. TaxID=2025608 RepID=UPI003D1353CC
MFVHKSGTSFTVYVQNNQYAQQTLKNREEIDKSGGSWAQSGELDKGLDDYLNKIVDAIPELKASQEAGIGVGFVILPESASDGLKQGVSLATDKMIKDGTNPDILKSVLGIVKDTFSCDIENNNGYALIKNDTSSADMNDLNNVMEKIKNVYGNDKVLSESLSKFADYLNEIWGHLNKQAGNNDAGSIFTSSGSISYEEKKGQFLNTYI